MGAEQSQLQQRQDVGDYQKDYISFFVNGREYNVKIDGSDPDIDPNYVLVDYLRDKLGLTGTKYMCRDGGCGACIVIIKASNDGSADSKVRSVNSCLMPLFSCDGLEITTVEHLGDRKVGYHQIQERLVNYGGTLCGFCTPGFVMNMYSVATNNPNFTGGEVEYSFDGNLCRCTGYRPIIDAFKSLVVTNPSGNQLGKCRDIEDVLKCPVKPSTSSGCFEDSNLEIVQPPRNMFLIGTGGEQWLKVTSLPTLFDILEKFSSHGMRYRLLAGNTAIGIYKNDGPFQGIIEVNDIPELHFASLNESGLTLGGGTTLTAAIDEFRTARDVPGFVYAAEFYKLFRRMASLSIRNRATLAGNLMMKHAHREFISDIFILFESVGATVKIGSSTTLYKEYNLLQFLDLDMNGKVILSIHLPVFRGNYVYRTFKIGKRYQNSQAYVNAAFLFNVDTISGYTVTGKPSICYGGINPIFIHAIATEQYLSGKQLTVTVLQNALSTLKEEAVPNFNPTNGSPEYRLGLAQSYLYKFVLGIRGTSITPRLQSGAGDVERALNYGSQTYDTDKSKWPLTQPIPKLESLSQASGEAEFIDDIRSELDELFGVFVLTTVANATIKAVDVSEALLMPDVVAFITAKDVPGVNSHAALLSNPEEIFVSKRVLYAGQAVGLIVARSKYAAFDARSKVKVIYSNIEPPVLDIRNSSDTIRSERCHSDEASNDICIKRANQLLNLNVQKSPSSTNSTAADGEINENTSGNNIVKVEGELYTDRQYHFHLENQICICVPKENGLKVFSSTQHMDGVQAAIAAALKVPTNTVNVKVCRVGGSFGAKVSKAAHIACACAVAAYVTNKPVRIVLDLETNMKLIGKRAPYHIKYSAVVDPTGKIYRLDADIHCDVGAVANEPSSLYAMICTQSCYRANGWSVTPSIALTNTAPNTYSPSTGSAEGIAAIETIIEHIAFTINKDPWEVRQVNFIRKGDPLIGVPGATLPLDNLIPRMMQELSSSADYLNRKRAVEEFNRANRWKKRGISMIPQRYPNYYSDLRFPTLISVYHVDGTVTVSHGGIETGQGINTKVAQVVAYTLQISIEKVKVQCSTTIISPNTAITGASITTELVCSSARRACKQLLAKLTPLRTQLKNPPWEELIAAANTSQIRLTAQAQEQDGDLISYDIWGVAMTEVEVDVLTGDYKLIRSDIIQDAGESINPLLDIGQIEGNFVMGLGWWLTEELVYDQSSGELLTDNTWLYKPMLPADIPEDINITLLRNAPNPFGVLSSKATGEPPFNLSISAAFALRFAIDSARNDVGNDLWYEMDAPVTREVVRKLALTATNQFAF